VRQGKLTARLEPVREVVALAVKDQTLRGNRVQLLDQTLQIVGAVGHAAVGHVEDERAETEIVHDETPQLVQQRRRTLEQETRLNLLGQRRVARDARLQHDRNVRPHLAHERGQLHTGALVQFAALGELDVRDHTEDVLRVGHQVVASLLVRLAQQNLRPRAIAQHLLGQVQPLGDQTLRVRHHLRVDHRQKRRVETHVVLDDDDRRHAADAGIEGHVHPILGVLDHRQQDPHVTLPEEDPVERGDVLARAEIGQLAVAVCEQDHRDVETQRADLPRQFDGVHPADVHARDDQIDVRPIAQQFDRLGTGGNPVEIRVLAQVEVEELTEDRLA